MSENKEEKSKACALKEKLFRTKKSGCRRVSEEEIISADEFCEEYKSFLNSAKTEREAVVYAIETAKNAGFTEYDRSRT